MKSCFLILSLFICASSTVLSDTLSDEVRKDLPADLADQVVTDLGTLAGFQGPTASPLNGQIFGGESVNGAQYIQFFNQRINSFNENPCGGGSAVAACVYPGTHTMNIANGYKNIDMPQIERISIMLHESRHTEGEHNNWAHMTCPTPYKDENGDDIRGHDSHVKMEGLPACDQGPYGAYGIQVVFLKNITNHCENCSDKIKMDAQIYSDSYTLRIVSPQARELLQNDN